MRTMPLLSFEELHEAAPCRDQVGTKQGPSKNRIGVQSPTQSDKPIQRLLLALTDEEKSSVALPVFWELSTDPTFGITTPILRWMQN